MTNLRTKNFFVCLLLGVVIGGVYYNALSGGFVFDDYLIVVSNPILPKVAAQPWLAIFPGVLGYRPFRTLSYVLDFHLGGMNPWIFHFNNLLYHWITTCLVFFISLRIVRDLQWRGSPKAENESIPGWCWFAALCTALLWALHPIQTDAVTYISGRRDLLSTLFFLVGFFAFLVIRIDGSAMSMGRRVILITVAFLAYMLGMASKEMAVTLPIVIFAYDFVREPLLAEHSPEPSPSGLFSQALSVVRKYRWLYLPLFLGAIAFTWYAVFEVRPSKNWGWYGGSAANNFLTVARVWVYYLSLLFYPHTLIADYTGFFPIAQSLTDWHFLAPLGLLGIGGVLILIALRRKLSVVAFAGLWFAITLLPVSHIVPHHELLAEHYLYLPSIGFCLGLGYGVSRALSWLALQEHKSLSLLGRGAVAVGLCCLLIFYGMRTIKRNADWKDEMAFYSRLVADNPRSARARLGLGYIYDRSGMPRAAITQYHVGLKLSPGDPRLYINLGATYQKLQMLREAERAYLTALEIVPDDMRVQSNLGFLYTELRQYDKARTALVRAEQLSRGKDPAVYANLGELHVAVGELAQAIQAYRKAVELAPTNTVFSLKLKALEKQLAEGGTSGQTPTR